MKYCLNCQQLVDPQKKFNWIVFIILLCCTFFLLWIPAIIYLIYYAVQNKKCPMCNSTNWGARPGAQSQTIIQGSQQIKFCPNCGKPTENNFCLNCNIKI